MVSLLYFGHHFSDDKDVLEFNSFGKLTSSGQAKSADGMFEQASTGDVGGLPIETAVER